MTEPYAEIREIDTVGQGPGHSFLQQAIPLSNKPFLCPTIKRDQPANQRPDRARFSESLLNISQLS
ncbi:MAG: hypothetical protein O7F14_10785 [Alphaproteobacteria bacterium]|nr:hypothetical protein [Alphaproteobacteria bacterium]